jgi:hypothetical protein
MFQADAVGVSCDVYFLPPVHLHVLYDRPFLRKCIQFGKDLIPRVSLNFTLNMAAVAANVSQIKPALAGNLFHNPLTVQLTLFHRSIRK